MMDQTVRGGGGRGRGVLLWVLAFLLMAGSAVYQRLTGPTHPLRGSFEVAGQEYSYRLTRSGWSYAEEPVRIPSPGAQVSGVLYYKRFKTDDDLSAVPMRVEGDELVGDLPRQPAAGKLEYTIILETPTGRVQIPDGAEPVVIRFKDDVPIWVLLPHVIFMFFAVLWGIRAGLSALVQPQVMARHAWTSLVLMTVGGLVLGPIVQKLAFGAYWTGFPFGYDLTDNKTLLLWLVWVIACGTLLGKSVKDWQRRAVVLVATVVMLFVYVIPHSARGSELDYSKLDQGVPASEAIDQG
jgi:hypothetical protein